MKFQDIYRNGDALCAVFKDAAEKAEVMTTKDLMTKITSYYPKRNHTDECQEYRKGLNKLVAAENSVNKGTTSLDEYPKLDAPKAAM